MISVRSKQSFIFKTGGFNKGFLLLSFSLMMSWDELSGGSKYLCFSSDLNQEPFCRPGAGAEEGGCREYHYRWAWEHDLRIKCRCLSLLAMESKNNFGSSKRVNMRCGSHGITLPCIMMLERHN